MYTKKSWRRQRTLECAEEPVAGNVTVAEADLGHTQRMFGPPGRCVFIGSQEGLSMGETRFGKAAPQLTLKGGNDCESWVGVNEDRRVDPWMKLEKAEGIQRGHGDVAAGPRFTYVRSKLRSRSLQRVDVTDEIAGAVKSLGQRFPFGSLRQIEVQIGGVVRSKFFLVKDTHENADARLGTLRLEVSDTLLQAARFEIAVTFARAAVS